MLRIAQTVNLAVGTLIVVASLIFAGNVYATESSGVGGKPANPREDNPRTTSIFVHELTPATEVRDAVVISNTSNTTKKVLVYSTDAQVSSGGAFACEQKADPLDQEGSWVTLDKAELELQSGKEETIGFTIRVPQQASVGEHNACIAIQAVEPAQPSQVNGVTLSFRSAIRVAITVPGDFKKELIFESLTVSEKDNGKLLANQVLQNNGNVSLDTKLDTKLKTLIGTTAGSTDGEYPILAGQRAEFNFELPKPMWGGFYRVVAAATYSNDPTTSLGEEGGDVQQIEKNTLVFIKPHPIVLLIYLIVISSAIGAVVLYKRKRTNDTLLREKAILHKIKKNDDIVKIAEHYGADWKQTAKLNNLKAPYVLSVGQELSVVPAATYQKPKPKVTKETKKPDDNKPKIQSKKTTPAKKTNKTTKTTSKSSSTTKKSTKATKKKPTKNKSTKPKPKNSKE